MTKKLTDATTSSTKGHMELDLDSFLNSRSTSDSDSPNSLSVPHRTLDEILHDSDSDSHSDSDSNSSVPALPPSLSNHNRRFSDLLPSQNYTFLQHTQTESLNSTSSQSEQSRSNSFTRARSIDPVWRVPASPPPASSSASRPLPSLFGGVKSKAKPGAALAAAAAASRSVPTPHAAAIKSRRASNASSGTAENLLDNGESASNVSDDNDIVSNSSYAGSSPLLSTERSTSEDRLGEENEKINKDNVVSTGDENLDTPDEVLDSTNVQTETEAQLGANHNAQTEAKVQVVAECNVQTDAEVQSGAQHVLQVDQSVGQDDHSTASVPACTNEHVAIEKDASKLLEVNSCSKVETDNDINYQEDSTAVLFEEPGVDTSGGDGEDGKNGISELVEDITERSESDRISKRLEKLKSVFKPLELAEELEKKQAYTGLHWEEGAAAQPMKLEGVRKWSTTLGYFDVNVNNVVTGIIASHGFRRDHGSPQVLAVHVNYIAVGMSKGVIVVVPSRYSPHNIDNMDAKMLMLGLQGDRSHAAVTSICFNQQGDLLLAGYGDGHITLWDVQRASLAKVISGEHTAPVVHTFFLGQDSQLTRQFKAITGDSKGLVLLHTSSVVPLLNRFSIKSQCLLDGQKTGTVLSASPLLFDESYGSTLSALQGSVAPSASSIGSMMGGVVGGEAGWKLFNEGSSSVEEGVVVFATHQTALVVRLTPTLEIYAQLSKPDGAREGSMPYTAWKCTPHSRSSSTDSILTDAAGERVSLLAIAWDRKVQVAKLVKSELKVYGNWSLDSTAIGVAWLDEHMLVILTLTGNLILFAKDGTVIHQTSFSVDGYGGEDLVAYHTHFLNIYGNPEKAYQNSIAVRGASVYILGPTHLIISRLLPWKERINVLRRAGDWMGALNMAMTLYDGEAHGVIDLPKSVDAVREIIMPYLAELLLSYVDEVFSYMSVAFGNQIGKVELLDNSKSGSSSVLSEIKEQFTRIGGVAVEFCVHIQQTDILFDEVFPKFVAEQHRDTFLELLEPYILRDMLGSLPPEIMQALVEHYSAKGWLQRVEQCVLHMDISSLDFNQVVRLCREHGLYGALVYLFNKGLDDFRAPLEELLVVSRNAEKETSSALRYRMLVYLKYCFSGLAFPPGHGVLSPTRLPSLRMELVQFLLENSDAPSLQAATKLPSRATFLNLHHLLELDTEATLDVLRCAFVDDKNPISGLTSHVGGYVNADAVQGSNTTAESLNLLVQQTINALILIVEDHISQGDPSASSNDRGSVEAWPSKKDVGHLFEFIAYHVACRKASVSQGVLGQILEYLISEVSFLPNISACNTEISKKRENQVLALLKAVPESDWNASHVLQLCEKASFHKVCGLIHTIRRQYLSALDSYMKDIDEPVHTFSYINEMLKELSDNELDAFRSAVISRIPELVILSRECTFFLIVDHFSVENPDILSGLHGNPKSFFLFLKTVIEVHLSGALNFSYLEEDDDNVDASNGKGTRDAYLERISEFPKFMRNNPVYVTDDVVELYFELLCKYERNSVLKFLETFDSYRVEKCLRLCQEHGIIDAAAFLLERVGDVGSALLLTLSGLNDNFCKLDTAVERVISKVALDGPANVDHYSLFLKMEEVDHIRSILHACIGLCRRNTPRLQPDESEILWFRLLDSFCEPLMESFSDSSMLKGKNYVGMLAAETLGSQGDDEALIIKWKISKSHIGAHILRKLFSLFIKEIVEGMIGYVRLPTIMSKLLSDNGSQEFGDFKMTILGMLGTYGFERRILDTARSLIEDDTFYTMSMLKKGASHGYAPLGVICCICNCPLAKKSCLSIRVFNCGHATHLDCELMESESSKVYLSGCPVCMPKKNTQMPRNKSAIPENGLVNAVSSRPHRALGSSLVHPHEDSFEISCGLQQISRFEILSNLQKDQTLGQIESMPPLRLAPPAIYHEKVKKGPDLLTGESSRDLATIGKTSKSKQLKELKIKGSSLRFPLKSSIFSKEKSNK